MAALEAKRASIGPVTAQDQGRNYAEQLEVPFVSLSNGEEVWFLDHETDAHARKIAGFYSQDDLERRAAAQRIRLDLSTVETDRRIVDRDYQTECIKALCDEISYGRRNLLVEMATGTGKTRTAAEFVKRLFEAMWQQARTTLGARIRPFEHIRSITGYLVFPTWEALFDTLITGIPPPQRG